MRQTWRNLLFAHWRVPPEALRAVVPAALELDTFEGAAWIGIVPFWMTDIRPRGLPSIPGVTQSLELNVRTYVVHEGRHGVYFFSLDAESLAAVLGARVFYCLPYFYAEMSMRVGDDERIRYRSRRRSGGAALDTEYQPCGDPFLSRPGTLDHWLTERYCLLTLDRRGRVLIGDIHHAPWPLQPSRAEFDVNTMTAQIGIELPREQPLLHYARKLEVLVWWPARA